MGRITDKGRFRFRTFPEVRTSLGSLIGDADCDFWGWTKKEAEAEEAEAALVGSPAHEGQGCVAAGAALLETY